jgi:hypothetical protein
MHQARDAASLALSNRRDRSRDERGECAHDSGNVDLPRQRQRRDDLLPSQNRRPVTSSTDKRSSWSSVIGLIAIASPLSVLMP